MTILTEKIYNVLVTNENFFGRNEQTFARRLIKWSKGPKHQFCHRTYLNYVLKLNLAKQKVEVQFLVKVFGEAGIKMNAFEIRYYETARVSKLSQPNPANQKAALAKNSEIQGSCQTNHKRKQMNATQGHI